MDRFRIEQMKQLAKMQKDIKRQVSNTLPAMYACIAKVLFEKYKMDGDTIADVFYETEKAWQEATGREDTMIEWCEEVTGIEIRGTFLED